MWYNVDIHTCGHYAINIEVDGKQKEQMVSDWQAARLDYSSRLCHYEGRREEEVRVDPRQDENGRPIYNYVTKYVPAYVLVDMGEVMAIEWREAVEKGE